MKTQIGLGVLSLPNVLITLGIVPGILCLIAMVRLLRCPLSMGLGLAEASRLTPCDLVCSHSPSNRLSSPAGAIMSSARSSGGIRKSVRSRAGRATTSEGAFADL